MDLRPFQGKHYGQRLSSGPMGPLTLGALGRGLEPGPRDVWSASSSSGSGDDHLLEAQSRDEPKDS